MTGAQEQRITRDLTEHAGEAVRVERAMSVLYAFGSELACLRIFAKYQANGAVHNPKARVGYSANLETYYFSLEMSA